MCRYVHKMTKLKSKSTLKTQISKTLFLHELDDWQKKNSIFFGNIPNRNIKKKNEFFFPNRLIRAKIVFLKSDFLR